MASIGPKISGYDHPLLRRANELGAAYIEAMDAWLQAWSEELDEYEDDVEEYGLPEAVKRRRQRHAGLPVDKLVSEPSSRVISGEEAARSHRPEPEPEREPIEGAARPILTRAQAQIMAALWKMQAEGIAYITMRDLAQRASTPEVPILTVSMTQHIDALVKKGCVRKIRGEPPIPLLRPSQYDMAG